MLLVIVVLFLICHTLRIILNIHGLISLKSVRESIHKGCSGVTQTWTLIGASVSHILLTINSSINFFIYCFMCTPFRRILFRLSNCLNQDEGGRKSLIGLSFTDGLTVFWVANFYPSLLATLMILLPTKTSR